MPENLVQQYSGVVFSQNQAPAEVDDRISLVDAQWRYQEFFLPENYARGDDRFIPPLTGIQVFVSVDPGADFTAALDWVVEYQVFGVGWVRLAEGTAIGAQSDGDRVWMDLLFDTPAAITEEILTQRLRFGIRGRLPSSAPERQPVDYANGVAVVAGRRFEVVLVEGVPYPVTVGGTKGFLYFDPQERTVTYSVQHGVSAIWYSVPNPLAASFASAKGPDGVTTIGDGGREVSFCFRVLGLTADEGVDFLGNTYRSAVKALTGEGSLSWMSKPNPSRFAVESRYFDVRNNRIPVVIDHVLVDPLTPGIYFQIYYSNEGGPVSTEEEWENKLWTHVPQTFRATKRESHALPAPITASYIKIEFSHLQAKHYSPGDFAKPTKYKKHPKWVLDYFLARLESDRQESDLLPGRVGVVYDALDLAYNYYLDDLTQTPEAPVHADDSTVGTVTQFLANRSDFSDRVDPTVLAKINLSMAPYQEHVSVWSKDRLLSQLAQASDTNDLAEYPVERSALAASSDVAVLRNSAVIFENDYPVMFFYLTCRHKYREVVAPFDHDRAYFAGVQEIAFLRDRYTTSYDGDQYIEASGDLLNASRNDFYDPSPVVADTSGSQDLPTFSGKMFLMGETYSPDPNPGYRTLTIDPNVPGVARTWAAPPDFTWITPLPSRDFTLVPVFLDENNSKVGWVDSATRDNGATLIHDFGAGLSMLNPYFSFDNGRIFVLRWPNLYRVNIDGSSVVALTSALPGPGNVRTGAGLNEAGTQYLCATDTNVLSVNTSTGSIATLLTIGGGNLYSFAVSPDGSRFAVCDKSSGLGVIKIYKADGTHLFDIPSESNSDDYIYPSAFSIDNKIIVDRSFAPGYVITDSEVKIYDRSGSLVGSRTNMTMGSNRAWSPDGDYFAGDINLVGTVDASDHSLSIMNPAMEVVSPLINAATALDGGYWDFGTLVWIK